MNPHNEIEITEGAYRLDEDPLLKQITVQRDATIPIAAKISVVAGKPISVVPDPDRRESESVPAISIPNWRW